MNSIGHTIVITGTSRGIGRDIAEYFLGLGHKVYGCSRSQASVAHENYIHHCINIADENQVRRWVREIKTNTNKIDCLVCSAGIVSSALQMTLTSSKIVEDYLKTSFAGTYYVCREFSKVMILQKSGSIIAISSTMTILHEPGTSMYSSCKSAIEQLIKVMARELSPFSITCNAIGLSYVMTETSKTFGDDWEKRMLEKQTIKRPLTTAEIGDAILFFASENSRCITGQVLFMGLVS